MVFAVLDRYLMVRRRVNLVVLPLIPHGTWQMQICSLCSAKSEQPAPVDVESFESMDLDTRPVPPERWTMDAWIQECPNCGVCCRCISRVAPIAAELINTDRYRQQLNSEIYPRLANRFLCHAWLSQRTERYCEEIWSTIYAAWVCDDAALEDAAVTCRKNAAELLTIQMHEEMDDRQAPLSVDLLRRAGDFEQAAAECDVFYNFSKIPGIGAIIDYQLQLIAAHDTDAYTVADVIGELPPDFDLRRAMFTPDPIFPCPHCGAPLASDKAKQCFSCGVDWH